MRLQSSAWLSPQCSHGQLLGLHGRAKGPEYARSNSYRMCGAQPPRQLQEASPLTGKHPGSGRQNSHQPSPSGHPSHQKHHACFRHPSSHIRCASFSSHIRCASTSFKHQHQLAPFNLLSPSPFTRAATSDSRAQATRRWGACQWSVRPRCKHIVGRQITAAGQGNSQGDTLP